MGTSTGCSRPRGLPPSRSGLFDLGEIQFHLRVKVGEEVSVDGRLEREGRTSMATAIEAWRRNRHQDEEFKVTEAVFTFVAVDAAGKSRPVASGSHTQES